MFWAIGRLIVEEQDEFQRMLIVRQALIATGFALSIAPSTDSLAHFDVSPCVDLFWAAMLWFLGLALARSSTGSIRHLGPMRMNNRLKVLRAERDWSQQELADRLEVSRQSVNAIETGKYDPSLPLAFRIAELFALPIEDIFDPKG